MCGIAFQWLHESPTPADLEHFNQAVVRLRHRGPDERRVQSVGHCLLGHTRLSIVDLEQSQQPMGSPDQRYWLVFNGEIYNYRELRSQLEGFWQFRSEGDTEVLLAGLAIYGEEFINRLDGMWSLVFWDSQSEKLLASRDRTGKKPLFYRESPHRLSIFSELPALYAADGHGLTENLSATADFFRYGFYLPGTSAFQQIRELPPGCTLNWVPGENSHVAAYWRIDADRRFKGSKADAISEIQSLFQKAVKKRMVADVEVGCFLSGGVDSSLVTAYSVASSDKPVKTFSVGFTQSDFDESEYAAQVSRYFKTVHHVEKIDQMMHGDLLKLITDHLGQPFADPSLLPTQLVSRVAARHVKVALSGDGGDELFCGYQRYQARRVLRWYRLLPGPLRKILQKKIRSTEARHVHHSRSILKKAQLFVELAERQEAENPYVCRQFVKGSIYSDLFPGLNDMGCTPPENLADLTAGELRQMMLNDFQVYLPQDIHTKVDRASMSESLEVRAPFMDQELVELALSLPEVWQSSFKVNKPMLRGAFLDKIPRNIWKRRKQGFAVPVSSWFTGQLGVDLEAEVEMVPVHSPWISPSAIIRCLRAHREGVCDYSEILWSLWVYLKWKRQMAPAQ